MKNIQTDHKLKRSRISCRHLKVKMKNLNAKLGKTLTRLTRPYSRLSIPSPMSLFLSLRFLPRSSFLPIPFPLSFPFPQPTANAK